MNWGVLGVATISLWAILLVMGIWSWLMGLLVPVITMMLLMIAPCIINCLTILSLRRSTSYNSASPTRIYKTTADHRKYHSPLDGHHHEDSDA